MRISRARQFRYTCAAKAMPRNIEGGLKSALLQRLTGSEDMPELCFFWLTLLFKEVDL